MTNLEFQDICEDCAKFEDECRNMNRGKKFVCPDFEAIEEQIIPLDFEVNFTDAEIADAPFLKFKNPEAEEEG